MIEVAHLADEVQRVRSHKPCKNLANLRPSHSGGLLRVGGRLDRSQLSFEGRHPIILPNKNPVVRLLLRQMHAEQPHVGLTNPMNAVRQRCWLLNVRSSDAFLAALKRFLERRGMIHQLHSDNASNFRGAHHDPNTLIQQFRDQKAAEIIEEFSPTHKIEWHFIPPGAPEFEGLWKAPEKSVTSHQKHIVGNVELTLEETAIVLVAIEAVPNLSTTVHHLHRPGRSAGDPTTRTPSHCHTRAILGRRRSNPLNKMATRTAHARAFLARLDQRLFGYPTTQQEEQLDHAEQPREQGGSAPRPRPAPANWKRFQLPAPNQQDFGAAHRRPHPTPNPW